MAKGRLFTGFIIDRNCCIVDFELMSIQDNFLSCLADLQFDADGPLVAESTP